MKNKNVSSPLSAAALIAAFLAANSLIRAPFFKASILPFFAAYIIGAAGLTLLSKPLTEFFAAEHRSTLKKILYAFIAVAAVFAAVLAANEYCGFIYEAVLVRSNLWLIKITFSLCAFFLAVSDKSVIYKFSFLSAVMSCAVFFVLFLLSAKTFDLKNLSGAFDFSKFSFLQTGIYLIKMLLPGLAAIGFIGACGDIMPRRAAGFGCIFGAVLCSTAVIDSVLSFSLPLAARLTYPYIDDISTVSVGSLFTRMDGFAYFAFFTCYILKCAVCIKLSARLACGIGIKQEKVFSAICAAALILF